MAVQFTLTLSEPWYNNSFWQIVSGADNQFAKL